eukprot:58805_1
MASDILSVEYLLPPPPNSTVIKQEQNWNTNCCACCMIGPTIPRWELQSASQSVLPCGIRVDVLNELIRAINARAVQFIEESKGKTHYIAYGALAMVPLGIILSLIGWFVLQSPFCVAFSPFAGALVATLLFFWVHKQYTELREKCLDFMRIHIHDPKYRRQGIKWKIRSRLVDFGYKEKFLIRFDDFCVTR